jgi:hypothetical protein
VLLCFSRIEDVPKWEKQFGFTMPSRSSSVKDLVEIDPNTNRSAVFHPVVKNNLQVRLPGPATERELEEQQEQQEQRTQASREALPEEPEEPEELEAPEEEQATQEYFRPPPIPPRPSSRSRSPSPSLSQRPQTPRGRVPSSPSPSPEAEEPEEEEDLDVIEVPAWQTRKKPPSTARPGTKKPGKAVQFAEKELGPSGVTINASATDKDINDLYTLAWDTGYFEATKGNGFMLDSLVRPRRLVTLGPIDAPQAIAFVQLAPNSRPELGEGEHEQPSVAYVGYLAVMDVDRLDSIMQTLRQAILPDKPGGKKRLTFKHNKKNYGVTSIVLCVEKATWKDRFRSSKWKVSKMRFSSKPFLECIELQ